jgi:cysteine-rich repeat protein
VTATPADTPSPSPEVTPACGDGALAASEQCDDGNALSGDGCDATCRYEQLVPGKGSPRTDCLVEWAVVNPGNAPYLDRKGVPNFKQRCTDGDPACDVDGMQDGTCHFRIAVCARNADPNLPLCDVPPSLARYELQRPRPNASRLVDAANAASLLAAFTRLDPEPPSGKHGNILVWSPPHPGAGSCTAAAEIAVTLAGKMRAQIVVKGRAEGMPDPARAIRDSDKLLLRCEEP